MTAKELKEWVDILDPKCQIQVKRYGWEDLEYDKIQAHYTSSPAMPERMMKDACNLEDAT